MRRRLWSWEPTVCSCEKKTECKNASNGYTDHLVCIECGRLAKLGSPRTVKSPVAWGKVTPEIAKKAVKEVATKKTQTAKIKTRVAEITVETGTGDMFHLRDDNGDYIEVRDVDDEVVFQFKKAEAQALAAVLVNFAKGKV